MRGPIERIPTEERFRSKVDTSAGPLSCWPWTGAVNPKTGYGVFHPRRGVTVGAHRFSLQRKLGRPLTGWALHICDNPICVNPDHLYEGTHADNVRDAVSRDRHKRGERGAAKLTEGKVLEMRDLAARGELIRELASRYSIQESMVSLIIRGDRWASVGGPRTKRYKKE